MRLQSTFPAAVLLTLAAAATAVAAPDWSKAQTVTVIASDYQFTPARLAFRRGVPYRLHLENRGKDTHEFHAAAFFQEAVLRDPSVLNPDRNEVLLQPGDKKDVYFVAKRAGNYRLYCPDHDWAGMTGEITVK